MYLLRLLNEQHQHICGLNSEYTTSDLNEKQISCSNALDRSRVQRSDTALQLTYQSTIYAECVCAKHERNSLAMY